MSSQATRELESGSFRDRDSRVFYDGDRVLRGLSELALSEYEALSKTRFFPGLLERGEVVGTRRIEESAPGWAAVLEHERIPFVSYPYEWSFGMLRDAALLQLRILAAALKEDTTLKDASAYNVQWIGTRPVFIDVPSFVPLKPGDTWTGYRQFCELNLYPLLLQAYKGIPFQPWLRGSIDGITAGDCRAVLSMRDLLRKGVLMHVVLQAAAQARFGDTQRDVRADVKAAGFHRGLIEINVKKLTGLIEGLKWKQARSEWSHYAGDNSYDEGDRDRKQAFVRDAVAAEKRRLVWDLGSNTGDYARIAAESADYVVAMDGDPLAVERMYRQLSSEGESRILPLVVNLADPSPGLGWRGAERKSLPDRGSVDLTLALALIHHVVIGAHIPLSDFVDWLASLGSDLVIEFVSKEDPMVQKLLRNKDDRYDDYDQAFLEECLERHFEIVRKQPLESGTRTLYLGRRRG